MHSWSTNVGYHTVLRAPLRSLTRFCVKVWLYKLCGEPCEGIDRKRCRNIYLANLLVCMQNGVLDPPFLQSPHDIDVMNATEVFGPIPDTVEVRMLTKLFWQELIFYLHP